MTERTTTQRRLDPAPTADAVVEQNVAVVGTNDRGLRWGPIIAGLVTAFSTFLLLSLLAIGAGLASSTPNEGPDAAVATIVASLIALVSFFLGGFVAAWSAATTHAGRGALHGFLVWGTWLLTMLLLSGMGLGTIFGEVGSTLGNVRAPDVEPEQVLDALTTGAFGTFLALALSALAATLGGVVGTHDELYNRGRRR